MEISIKNMVCDRCIRSVNNIFSLAGVPVIKTELGKVVTEGALTKDQLQQVRAALEEEGFEVIDDQRIKLVEQIKQLIIGLVHYKELDEFRQNLSGYIGSQLNKDYTYLSNLFSSVENTTIEQYFIQQKIEKVKEWLAYNELTLSEISFKLGYSSVAHLSNQFRKITGFTPSQFKKLKEHNRKKLDSL